MADIIIRYLHFIAFIVLAASLIGEHILIDKKMDRSTFRKVLMLDGVYGVSAILVFLFGFLLWFVVGKPSDYYSGNSIFQLKIALFVVLGILSIVPTVFYIKNRNFTSHTIEVPVSIIYIIRIEILLFALLPLLALLMARGYTF